MDADKPLIMVAANQAWNLVNFRAPLIAALLADGWRVMAVAPADPVWQRKLEAMGCAFVAVPFDAAGANIFREGETIVRLRRLMRRHRPAAWISWTIKPNIYGALAAPRSVACLPNISGLGTVFIRATMLTRLVHALYRTALRRCPSVFFQNEDDRALFVARRLVPPGAARLLPGSGIDLAHFRPAPRPDPPARTFVMIARVLADKGVREFAAAARQLRAEMPDCRFLLVGPHAVANRTAIPAEEIRAWCDEGILEWRDAIDDVRPIIAAADWIVLPSYREGLSRVLLEAAAMGRPIVTTDVPGCRDLVTEGENGYLARPRDAASLAAALRKAAQTDDAEWARMAAAGRRRVEAEYSVERVVRLYRDALADARVAASRLANMN